MVERTLKKAIKKYHQTEKGKAALKRAQKKYEATRKAKARARKYAMSSKGKETIANCRLMASKCSTVIH